MSASLEDERRTWKMLLGSTVLVDMPTAGCTLCVHVEKITLNTCTGWDIITAHTKPHKSKLTLPSTKSGSLQSLCPAISQVLAVGCTGSNLWCCSLGSGVPKSFERLDLLNLQGDFVEQAGIFFCLERCVP